MASLLQTQNENDKNMWQIDDVHVKKLNGSIKNQFLIKIAKTYSIFRIPVIQKMLRMFTTPAMHPG